MSGRRLIPISERFWAKVDKTSGHGPWGNCWLWQASRKSSRYGGIGRGRAEDGTAYAHRVSWEIHHGPVPPGLDVLHECDTPLCVNPAHLFLGTQADNMLDMASKGRHGQAKLTAEQVAEIRRMYERGSKTNGIRALSRRFGVARNAIFGVLNGKSWRWLSC